MSIMDFKTILLLIFFYFTRANCQTCDNNAVCEKTETGFNCTCNSGYAGSAGGCININECATTSVCKNGEDCTDITGSYVCHCGGIDVKCDSAAKCETFNGTKNCECVDGYHGNGTMCQDIDECVVEPEACDVNANCSNTDGSFVCTCKAGYVGNEYNCTDIDECKNGNYTCTPPLVCNNIPGGYSCLCGEEETCDIDATCLTVATSSACTCNNGYTGDGSQCSDIDECSNTNVCAENAECTNTLGSFSCTCSEGYEGNGTVSCQKNSVKVSAISTTLLFIVIVNVWKTC